VWTNNQVDPIKDKSNCYVCANSRLFESRVSSSNFWRRRRFVWVTAAKGRVVGDVQVGVGGGWEVGMRLFVGTEWESSKYPFFWMYQSKLQLHARIDDVISMTSSSPYMAERQKTRSYDIIQPHSGPCPHISECDWLIINFD